MAVGIALIGLGVLLFHAGAIGLIINLARRASTSLPRFLLPSSLGGLLLGLAAIAGGIVLIA
ncbi:MAG: hypothetical protein GYB36_07035 [Alphaproteobacteria bacterium]|nr:hypothetical protein [Alphaproteobacteria bacterium]